MVFDKGTVWLSGYIYIHTSIRFFPTSVVTMDQKTHDGATKQSVLDFKCKKMLHEGEKKSTTLSPALTKKSGVVDSKNMEPNIACQTPEKINEGLHSKFHEGQVKLPDKWVTLHL